MMTVLPFSEGCEEIIFQKPILPYGVFLSIGRKPEGESMSIQVPLQSGNNFSDLIRTWNNRYLGYADSS